MSDSWWGDAWDSVSDTVGGWFGDDTAAADTSSSYEYGSAKETTYDDAFDMNGDTWSTEDYDDDSLWDTISSGASAVGSSTMDFLGTKAGTTMATTMLGMLGQYLMDDDDEKKTVSSSGSSGGGSGGDSGSGVEATTSSLGNW